MLRSIPASELAQEFYSIADSLERRKEETIFDLEKELETGETGVESFYRKRFQDPSLMIDLVSPWFALFSKLEVKSFEVSIQRWKRFTSACVRACMWYRNHVIWWSGVRRSDAALLSRDPWRLGGIEKGWKWMEWLLKVPSGPCSKCTFWNVLTMWVRWNFRYVHSIIASPASDVTYNFQEIRCFWKSAIRQKLKLYPCRII